MAHVLPAVPARVKTGVPRPTPLRQVCALGDSARRIAAVVLGQPTPQKGLHRG
jgi:hypothetical protein